MRSRRRPAQRATTKTATRPLDQTPALELAIDRLFPADVLANLRDPDRPAPERLDQQLDREVQTRFSC